MVKSKKDLQSGQRNLIKNAFKISGQIVVEYVLLLVIAVGIAALITNLVVSRSPDPTKRGFLVNKWEAIVNAIGDDLADDVE